MLLVFLNNFEFSSERRVHENEHSAEKPSDFPDL